ncbi:MAG: CDP-glycerol glycerophosphotransferase family protein [Candidatus Riflebacteria bacterium]|nr:CDP-glycerol glycerophosphotransferase family protein [Candidatus Riflebacteria bacterium]
MKNILIIVRNFEDLNKISSIGITDNCSYILASNDLKIHKVASAFNWIKEVVLIEQMESFYNVAEEVKRQVNLFNHFLQNLSDKKKGFGKEIFYWVSHCEGGITVQRLQDLFLLINSYVILLEKYQINQVHLFSEPSLHWEDCILIEVAKTRNVEVLEDKKGYGILARLKISFINIKYFLREFYFIVRILLTKFLSIFSRLRNNQQVKEVIIQVSSSADKQIVPVTYLMQELKKKDFQPVALSWGASPGADKLRKQNLTADELENFVSCSDIFSSIIRTIFSLSLAFKFKNKFLKKPEFNFNGVCFGKLMWFSILFFICSEMPQRYRFFKAAKRYFSSRNPLAINFTTTVLIESVILSRELLNKKKKPLFLTCPAGIYPIYFPYEHHSIPIDIFFVVNEEHKLKLEKNGIAPEKIEVAGHERCEAVNDFKAKTTKSESFKNLIIPDNFKHYFLFDLNTTIRGYYSVWEQILPLNSIYTVGKSIGNIAFLIKPHPSQKNIEQFKNYFPEQKNVFWLQPNSGVYDCLNIADLFITKFSAMGMEAILFDCPVIAVILDKEQKFQAFNDAAEYFYSTNDFETFLMKFCTDEKFRSFWNNSIKEKMGNYKNRYFGKSNIQKFLQISNVLKEKL